MIEIKGEKYPTVQDAAKQFEVSTKTVHDWIKKKIIPEPPKIKHGVRTVSYFPPDYIEKAKTCVAGYSEMRKKVK
jgi:hypothetical protein